MTLDRFLMYRNESLREIIQAYNKDGAGGSLDPVLKVAIGTLNNDLFNFRKLFFFFFFCWPRFRRQGDPYSLVLRWLRQVKEAV